MITTALIHDHRNRDYGPVEIRIIHERKTTYISTGIKVLRQNFVGGTVVNQMDSSELNRRLQTIYTRIQQEVNTAIEQGLPLDATAIKRKAWTTAEELAPDATPAIDWMEEQLPVLGLKEGTLKHYRTLIVRLREYRIITHWQHMTQDHLLDFDAWLHRRPAYITEAERATGKPTPLISDSGVYNYHKCLKALLNRAVLYKKLQINPYDQLRGQFRRGDVATVDYLTEEEMANFMAVNPPVGTAMDAAHDLFVFQMYTGLSYSDAQAFNIKFYKKINGKYIHTGERIKTGVPYVSQLLPPALAVVEKYGGTTPKLDNADYNRCLKALGMVAGIEKPLHSHMARHTFATFALRKGVKIENLSRMLGHTNITQTQRYAKVMAESVHEDFDLLKDSIKKGGQK